MGRMRGVGLVVSLVVTFGVWLYGHGHGSHAQASSAAYCADVSKVFQAVTDAHQGGGGTDEASHLGTIGSRLHADARSLDQWRAAMVSNDAVGQTIALDRVLSVVTTVPGC